MKTTPVYKLKDYKETLKFEKERPRQLRWDDQFKLYMLAQNKDFQGVWLKNTKKELVGEILMSWKSKSVLHIESFTVASEHQNKGIGHDLVKLAIELGTNSEFEYLTGYSQLGACWKIFEKFGAENLIVYKNWLLTGEDYIFFKIAL